MKKPLRIGIMGSAGSGKSQLARWLSSDLAIPLVDEGVREWLASRRLKEPNRLRWQIQLELQQQFVAGKILNESRHQAFVSDRTTIDAVVNLRLRSVHSGSSKEIPSELVADALNHARQTYDRIVLLRWNSEPQPQPDGVRETDPVRLRNEYDLCWSLCKLTGMRTMILPALPDKREVDKLVAELRD